MAYKDKFEREIVLDIDEEAALFAIQAVMKEGELRFRDALIGALEKDLKKYLDEVDYEPNMEWVDGVRYVIHLVREGDFGD